ncbi:26S proteasome non-ATPase regulatory subunit 4 [Pyxicephalus adspersus]|uniref:26S proteasome non-ATPase regulatory subunit 4 n=1 Tax=Pyxicephalus adspersus TaxID=30357 RepID=UPI003B58D207
MVLESTMVCVDNSEYMRNGDFLPTRLQAQQDAVNIVCHSKTRSNPENNVGLITLAKFLDSSIAPTLAPARCPPVAHPSADPELALALRVSMEEQRQRQEDEARRAAAASAAEAGITSTAGDDSDEALLKMTIGQQEGGRSGLPDFSSMTEDEQIAYAMQMSLQGAEFGQAESGDLDSSAVMDTSEPAKEEDDYDVMQDPEFLQSVLENLPGVDPNNEAIRNAMGSLASQASKDNKKDKKEEEKK